MASQADALQAIDMLSAAYPDKRLEMDTLQVYIAQLADIPGWLLHQAARRCIQTGNWFPRVSELRAAAVQISGVPAHELGTLAGRLVSDPLAAEAQRLEDAYYLEGKFEPRAWQALIAELLARDRPHRAESVRLRMQWIEKAPACPGKRP